MPFPEPGSHEISLDEAAAMTRRFRDTINPGDTIGGLFNSVDVQEILDQADCAGLRYYYAIDDDGNKVLVLVGVDANNQDLVNGPLAEISILCPTYCSDPNGLNS